MNRAPTIILRVIGTVAILCAAFGFWYNFTVLRTVLWGPLNEAESYFFPALYVMSTVCIACYALLTFFGIQFLRGRAEHLRRFVMLMGFEVMYLFFVAAMWLVPRLGMSVGAATGL